MNSILSFWLLFFTSDGPGYYFASHLLNDIVPHAEAFRHSELETSTAYFDIFSIASTTYKQFDEYLELINLGQNPAQLPIIGVGPPLIIEWYIDDEKLVQQIQSVIYDLATKQGS